MNVTGLNDEQIKERVAQAYELFKYVKMDLESNYPNMTVEEIRAKINIKEYSDKIKKKTKLVRFEEKN